MSAIDDLKNNVTTLEAKVTDLQNTVDAEQEQIALLNETNAAVVTELNNQIATLNDQLSNGATAEQIAEVSTSIQSVVDKITTTQADIASTVPDGGTGEPPVGEEPPTVEQ